jgi:hypothetical protein
MPVSAHPNGFPIEVVIGDGDRMEISSPPYFQDTRSDLRQRAKDVLRELHPLKIGYPELAEEGIEPKLLGELYAEIGIEIPLSIAENEKTKKMEPVSRAEAGASYVPMEPQIASSNASNASKIMNRERNLENPPEDSLHGDQALKSLQTPHESPIPKGTQNGFEQSPSLPKEVQLPKNQPQSDQDSQIVNPAMAQSSSFNPRPPPIAKGAKTPAAVLLGKPTIARSGEKALERKDYIARMLAAKAGKPIPVISTPLTTDNAINQPKESLSNPILPTHMQCDNPQKEQSLIIGNLAYRATESDLKEFFSAFPL